MLNLYDPTSPHNSLSENLDATEQREWWQALALTTGTGECPSCGSTPCPTPSFCAVCRNADERNGKRPRYVGWQSWPEAPSHILTDWDSPAVSLDALWSRFNDNRRQRYGGAPQSVYEAALYELRIHGTSQLSKPDCLRRASDLSTAQLRGLIAALIRLRPEYPKITDDLISKLGTML